MHRTRLFSRGTTTQSVSLVHCAHLALHSSVVLGLCVSVCSNGVYWCRAALARAFAA